MHRSLSLFVLVVVSFAGCAVLRDSPGKPLVIPQAGTIDQIEIGLTNAEGERRPPKIVITDHEKIDQFMDFLRSKNNNWRKPWDTFPCSQYTVSLWSKEDMVLVLWLSPSWIGGREFDGEKASDKRLRSLSPEEWAQLAQLLGLPKP